MSVIRHRGDAAAATTATSSSSSLKPRRSHPESSFSAVAAATSSSSSSMTRSKRKGKERKRSSPLPPATTSSSWSVQTWLLGHLPRRVYECLDSPLACSIIPSRLKLFALVPGEEDGNQETLRRSLQCLPFCSVCPSLLQEDQHLHRDNSVGVEDDTVVGIALPGRCSEGGITTLHLLCRYDATNTDHVALLRCLWNSHVMAVKDNIPPSSLSWWNFHPTHKGWASYLGFQRSDPSTDFRGGGLLSLAVLSHFVRHFPLLWREAVCTPEGELIHDEHPDFCFPAAASLNISFHLVVSRCHLAVEEEKDEEGVLGGGSQRTNATVRAGGRKQKKKTSTFRDTSLRSSIASYYTKKYIEPPANHLSLPNKQQEQDEHRDDAEPVSQREYRQESEEEEYQQHACHSFLSHSTSTSFDRLVLLHAVYFQSFIHLWRALPIPRNLMVINELLHKVYEQMDAWWLATSPGSVTMELEKKLNLSSSSSSSSLVK